MSAIRFKDLTEQEFYALMPVLSAYLKEMEIIRKHLTGAATVNECTNSCLEMIRQITLMQVSAIELQNMSKVLLRQGEIEEEHAQKHFMTAMRWGKVRQAWVNAPALEP